MIPTDTPFEFKRLQWPVCLAFTLFIHKPQGQSFKVANINLETVYFSDDQLYVTCSRVGTGKNLDVLSLMPKPETLYMKQVYHKNYISLNSLFLIKEAHKIERMSKRKRIFLSNLKFENKKVERET